jgi:hypothetical protein
MVDDKPKHEELKQFLYASFLYFSGGLYGLCFASLHRHNCVEYDATDQYRALASSYSGFEKCDP